MPRIRGTHRSEEEVAFDRHVGVKLRQARILNQLSQSDLGDPVNLTFQQIMKYENGTNRIGASRLWRFSQILKVPVSYFFEGLQEGIYLTSDDGDLADSIRRRSMELLSNFYAIEDDKVREGLYQLVKDMGKSGKGK